MTTQPQEKLDYFFSHNKIPNLIFHGSYGTGKRTIVYQFINRIYNFNKEKIKANVMFVNCSHGKGIKFIREELKFFAKINIQSNSGVLFKTIVLLNADHLTIDAQSALRRCIELFSHNTRFFIVVTNKHKLLNPILSRFCEIYIPETIDPVTKQVVNLHSLKNKSVQEDCFTEWFESQIVGDIQTVDWIQLCNDAYSRGYSSLDLMSWVRKSNRWTESEKSIFFVCFYKVKAEFRCEKMLLYFMLDFIYLCNNNYDLADLYSI